MKIERKEIKVPCHERKDGLIIVGSGSELIDLPIEGSIRVRYPKLLKDMPL